MSLRTSRPPTHPDAVVLACDKGHLPIALCVALRILELEPERRFDVAICTPDWEAIPDAWHDLPVRFVEIDVARVPAFVHPKAWISVGTFYRHVLPELLAADYGALLYLDTDVWLRRPGIQGLLDRAPRDAPLAAVPDFIAVKAAGKTRRRRSHELLSSLGGESGRYFQAGVLLMQTAPHVAARLGPRILDYATESAATLHRHKLGDQAALNAVAADVILPMTPLWNWHGGTWLRPAIVAQYNPYILHFTGPNKPWVIQDDPFVSALTPAYLALLEQHAPAFVPATREGSVPWLERHPRFGVPPLDATHRALRRARNTRKFGADARRSRAQFPAMDALIAAADIG